MDQNVLNQMQQQLQALQGASQQPQIQPMGMQQAAAPQQGSGSLILLPMEVDTPAGKCTFYLACPPGDVGQLHQLMQAGQMMVQAAGQMGLPLKAWQPKKKEWGGGGGRGGYGGGNQWGRGGGGW